MFRLLQGDVGSGKTIISLIAASNVIESNFQVAFMAPTEILAKQHYNLAKNMLSGTNINIGILTGKTKNSRANPFRFSPSFWRRFQTLFWTGSVKW